MPQKTTSALLMPLFVGVFFLFQMLFSAPLQAQNADAQTFLRRIPFSEKQNKAFSKLPYLLLKAYCEGRVKGYYPLAPDLEAPYAEFSAHFGFPLAEEMQAADNSLTPTLSTDICLEETCPNLDPLSLDCFEVYLDLFEEQALDTRKGRYSYKTKWIRLVYSHTCTNTGLEYYGAIFKYEDLLKLGERFDVPNVKNQAQALTIGQIFSQRLFSGFIIEHNGETIENPAEYTEEQDRKVIYKDVQIYED
ncbi:hypothetical protein [Hugenholtzia roseola]|uniref:hypothetical protein n=1 Tax=Hugenholtzia roseola TaxID=1002 RepID=UPI000400D7D2|nr:hypothetical protein [Hugenholtzia roseola]